MTLPLRSASVSAELYQEIQHFYARHMRLLDEGHIEEWAEGFTEDGVFASNARPEPSRGRATIVANTRAARQRFAAQGLQRRHWLGMMHVDPGESDGELLVRSYALIVSTGRGAKPVVHLSATCDDVLVATPDGWRIRCREVRHDDLG